MKYILLWIWQLPQNLIGFFLTRKYYLKSTVSSDIDFPVYYKFNFFNSCVSLGDYIIADYWTAHCKDRNPQKHEYGHHLQSLRLGWLNLLIIGLPLITFNIYDRIFHKEWDYEKRCKWYYSLPWEYWADKLGGVKRSSI